MRGLRFLEDYLTDFDNFWCFEKPRCPSIHFSNFREDPRGIWDNPRANPSIQSISGPKTRSERPSQPAPIINISHQNHSNSFQDVLECSYHRLQLIFTYQTVRNCWRSGVVRSLWRCFWRSPLKRFWKNADHADSHFCCFGNELQRARSRRLLHGF